MIELASNNTASDASPLMTDESLTTQDVHQQNYIDEEKNDAHGSDSDDNEDELPLADETIWLDSRIKKPSALPPTPSLDIQTTPSTTSTIKHKLLLLLPLLISLYMLTDTTYLPPSIIERKKHSYFNHHLAFITALSRHPPSLRVFRIVSECAWLLLCASFALWVWEQCGKSSSCNVYEDNNVDDVGRKKYSDANSNNIGTSSSSYKDEKDDVEESKQSFSALNPSTTNGHSKRNCINNNTNDTSTAALLQITPEIVGKLLFAPPPSTITSNAAWEVFVHRRRKSKRRKKRSSSSTSNRKSSSGDIILEDSESDNGRQNMTKDSGIRKSADQKPGQDYSPSSTPSYYPPSSKSVLGAALDIMILSSMFLLLYTISSAEGGRYIDTNQLGRSESSSSSQQQEQELDEQQQTWMKYIANIAAPIFPLTLFFISILILIIPWYKRKVLWTIISLTIGAPYYSVTFRDGFIGDVLTSTVRPLQDLAFTLFFIPVGVKAWWSPYNRMDDVVDIPLERNWLLHTVVLPACTLSPLWWRFLQNLRQCYDAKKRWPYLGNALKYLLAAEVTTFAMFDPSLKRSPFWLTCFFVATMYQVWWDVFMDWGLLERKDTAKFHYSLRTQRLYKRKWVYYAIFGINFCLRFVGMLTLIPPVYLSRSTGLIVHTYNDPDFQLFVGSLIASAEIFRRTIWALLRLEWEVIKTDAERRRNEIYTSCNEDKILSLDVEEDMKPMAIASSSDTMLGRGGFAAWPSRVKEGMISMASLSDMSNLNDIQILSELCVWATVFSGIAIIAAAHREVL